MPNIGPLEIGIVLLIVLIIFGPKRLPGLGKQLGTGMREFKETITPPLITTINRYSRFNGVHTMPSAFAETPTSTPTGS